MKERKPIYKRAWFWVLAVVILACALGNGGNSSRSEAKNDSEKESNETVEMVDMPEDKKAVALEVDKVLWGIVENMAVRIDGLQDALNQNDDLVIYQYADESGKKFRDEYCVASTYSSGDSSAYADEVLNNLTFEAEAWGNLKKYVNKGEMKYLDKFQKNGQTVTANYMYINAARLQYLMNAGFTSDEADAIIEGTY